MSIVALLVALLLPAMAKARLAGKRTLAASNLRQAGVAIQVYRGDYKDQLPGNNATGLSAWVYLLEPYVTSKRILYTPTACPGFVLRSNPARDDIGSLLCNINIMGTNAQTVRRPLQEVRYPSSTFMITHGGAIATWSPVHFDQAAGGISQFEAALEGTGLNVQFVDQHIRFVPYQGEGLSEWWQSHPAPAPSSSGWVYRGYKFYGW